MPPQSLVSRQRPTKKPYNAAAATTAAATATAAAAAATRIEHSPRRPPHHLRDDHTVVILRPSPIALVVHPVALVIELVRKVRLQDERRLYLPTGDRHQNVAKDLGRKQQRCPVKHARQIHIRKREGVVTEWVGDGDRDEHDGGGDEHEEVVAADVGGEEEEGKCEGAQAAAELDPGPRRVLLLDTHQDHHLEGILGRGSGGGVADRSIGEGEYTEHMEHVRYDGGGGEEGSHVKTHTFVRTNMQFSMEANHPAVYKRHMKSVIRASEGLRLYKAYERETGSIVTTSTRTMKKKVPTRTTFMTTRNTRCDRLGSMDPAVTTYPNDVNRTWASL